MIHEHASCIIIWQSPIVITTPLATIHLLFCEIYKHITYYAPRTDFLYYNLTIPHRDYTPLATIHLFVYEIYKHITYYDPRTYFLYYNRTIPHRVNTTPHPPPPWLQYTYYFVKSTNTLPTMVHEQTSCTIIWQSPIVMTLGDLLSNTSNSMHTVLSFNWTDVRQTFHNVNTLYDLFTNFAGDFKFLKEINLF